MNSIKNINKDIILREKLALQRTLLANQSTFLSFLRTSMYFMMAGLTIQNVFDHSKYLILEIVLFVISGGVFLLGIYNYFKNKKEIEKSEVQIGNFKADYLVDNEYI
ncbi:MAG: DUF202 domain-containing protein [Saprospiraceae bacterium]